MSKFFLTLFAACALFCYSPPIMAANIYVDATATGASTGSSWTDAYTNLHDAVADANATSGADNIYVASGYYASTTPYVFTSPATVTGGLLYGAPTSLENLSGASPIMVVIATDLEVSDTEFQNSLSHIASNSGGVRARGCRFSGALNGSVIGNFCWLMQFHQCEFIGNTTTTSGGAIYASDCAIVSLLESKFKYNRATLSGGAVWVTSPAATTTGTLSLLECESTYFVRNQTGGLGGALGLKLADAQLHNSVFKRNRAGDGGAIASLATPSMSSQLKAVNCTIFGNNAALSGGGIYLVDFANQRVFTEVYNCILWRNWAPPASILMKQVNRAPDRTHNSCVSGWGTLPWPGFANFAMNPFLMFNGNVSPLSPCVDAGDPALNPTLFDIAGNPRILGITMDTGAFEQ